LSSKLQRIADGEEISSCRPLRLACCIIESPVSRQHQQNRIASQTSQQHNKHLSNIRPNSQKQSTESTKGPQLIPTTDIPHLHNSLGILVVYLTQEPGSVTYPLVHEPSSICSLSSPSLVRFLLGSFSVVREAQTAQTFTAWVSREDQGTSMLTLSSSFFWKSLSWGSRLIDCAMPDRAFPRYEGNETRRPTAQGARRWDRRFDKLLLLFIANGLIWRR
jgi:hypothetical protein